MMSMRMATASETKPTDQRLLNTFGFVALLILGIVSTLFLMYPHHNQIIPHEHVHIVNVGENIWSIASTQYGEVADEWGVVYTIEQQNGIKGDIHAGQAIQLPVIRE